MISVSEAVAARKSVRAFLPDEVPEELLRSILATASRAPSGGNLQPWHVHVVTGRALENLKALMKLAMAEHPRGQETEFPIYPEKLKDVHDQRRRKVAMDMYTLLGIGKEDKLGRSVQLARNYDFFGAPVGLFFSIDRNMAPNQWAHLGMFMQTIALLAVEAGLSSCMQEAWAAFHKTVSDFLKLPDDRMLFCGMALGFEDRNAPVNQLQTERAPLENFCEFLSD